ncbi:LL-diaminopimelate aminotransferase [Candidatus Aerophobetes bacterium]|nr:LL-diaminopimelate aminotransferase [Candidatus Aerophobetes bacterium]
MKKEIFFERANRLKKLPVYLFAQVDEAKRKLKRKGVEIIDLGVGDPDIPTPYPVINRLIKAVQNPQNHRYPSYEGLLSFREQICKWYLRRFGVSLDPEKEVIALIGSKEGIAHISLGLLNPGDLVLIPEPGYPVYQAGAIFAGADIYHLPLLEDNNFLPSLKKIDSQIASRAKLMWINYPNNPTAAVADINFFKEVVEFAKKFNIIVCHDLAYSELSYDGYQAPSLLAVEDAREVGVEFHSLSKTFSMTGWRIGFAVGNSELIAALKAVKTNVDSGVFQAIQEAGEEALKQAENLIPEIRRIYRNRRDFFVKGLKEMGWQIRLPKATFYLWIKTPAEYTSLEFAQILLDKCGIVVTPGVGFGPSGEGYVRIALTVKEDKLKKALDRLKKLNLRNKNVKALGKC